MNDKDITEKTLEDNNDVFADIVDVLLYNGEGIIKENELINTKAKSQYKSDDSILHEQERDVSKIWHKNNIKIAIYGLENQTKIDKDMPLRIMGYDGASYKSQTLDPKNKERYPVISLVLYFGEERWNTPRSLYDCFDISPSLVPYVNDYKINVFEIAYLPDEIINKFKSDFRIIADFFAQKRKNKSYKPSSQKIRHVDEFLKLMKAITGDEQYIAANKEGGKETMCEIVDSFLKQGFDKGYDDGFGKGYDNGFGNGFNDGFNDGFGSGFNDGCISGQIIAYHDVGLSVKEIAEKLNCTEEKIITTLEKNS